SGVLPDRSVWQFHLNVHRLSLHECFVERKKTQLIHKGTSAFSSWFHPHLIRRKNTCGILIWHPVTEMIRCHLLPLGSCAGSMPRLQRGNSASVGRRNFQHALLSLGSP
ncbi:hypothetical protein ACFVAK_19695, partial [Bacillus velezensis]